MMTRYKKFRPFDVTAKKSNKIEFLQRMVNDASTVFAKAESKYNSFVEKANIFAELYNEAEVDLQTAEGYWKQFLQVKSDIKALNDTANEANLIAVDAHHDVRKLIIAWEEVTSETLKAAEAIVLTSNYIQKRKASNPLISDDLVKDAIDAAKAAEKTVATVVKAFKDALSALSSSWQANNSTELTDVYINIAMMELLINKNVGDNLSKILISENMSKANRDKILKMTKNSSPLEFSLKNAKDSAKKKTKLALTASESANKEMNKAKEELAQAQAALSTWNAALLAAETAVAG